jgi:hypothetical protein
MADKKKRVKENVVVLRVPSELYQRVEEIEQSDPEVLRSIVRAIFGSHRPPYFGVTGVSIEPQPPGAAVEKEKGKERKRRWDKSCL